MKKDGDSPDKMLWKFQLRPYDQTLYNQKQVFLCACIYLELLPKMQLSSQNLH